MYKCDHACKKEFLIGKNRHYSESNDYFMYVIFFYSKRSAYKIKCLIFYDKDCTVILYNFLILNSNANIH